MHDVLAATQQLAPPTVMALAGETTPPTREDIYSATKDQVLKWQKDFPKNWQVTMQCSGRLRQLEAERAPNILAALATASAGSGDYSR